ncbi:peptidase C14, caspase domain-containing protein, partial [Sparassis latifolia]
MPVPVRPPARKALSVAAQYSRLKQIDEMYELEGTHNDPPRIRELLLDVYGYRDEDITILMDDESGRYAWPTRDNIMKAMHELVADAIPGDHFVFHFSGHGNQVPNTDGTEVDGLDEVIWPVDVVVHSDDSFDNYIIDDDIHDILVNHLPPETHFVMIFDCCHSGTAADLPYANDDFCPQTPISPSAQTTVKSVHVRKGSESMVHTHTVDHDLDDGLAAETPVSSPTDKLSSNRLISAYDKRPDVTSWSACTDDEVTLEAGTGGLFVQAFTNALRNKPKQSNVELLRSVTYVAFRFRCWMNL